MITSSTAGLFVHANSASRLYPFEKITNGFRFQVYGVTNRQFRVETSTNLNSPTNWYSIFTNWTSFWYTNLGMTNDPMRFYRAITNN